MNPNQIMFDDVTFYANGQEISGIQEVEIEPEENETPEFPRNIELGGTFEGFMSTEGWPTSRVVKRLSVPGDVWERMRQANLRIEEARG